MSSEWVVATAALVAIGITVWSAVRSSGKVEASQDSRLKSIEAQLIRDGQHHDKHYDHERDSNIHWTSRERELLNETLKNIDSKVTRMFELMSIRQERRKDDFRE